MDQEKEADGDRGKGLLMIGKAFLSFVVLSQRLLEREDLVQYFARGFNLLY
jgi:hypothetical protein